MSSIRIGTRKDGSAYTQILFREHDPAMHKRVQSSVTFDDHDVALRWKKILDQVGPERARQILQAEQGGAPVVTVESFAPTYIKSLTGISEAQKNRYRAYMRNDIGPAMGSLPLSALCTADEDRNGPVQDWIADMEADGASGKTIHNKHGFLSAMLKVALRRQLLPFNPCEDSTLPPAVFEPCFLEPAEFDLLLEMTPKRWKPSVRFLTLSCVRWSEYTALRVGALKQDPKVADQFQVRVARAWKYTGIGEQVLGTTKTMKGVRTINVPRAAVQDFDLDRAPGTLLVETQDGGRISSQLFHNRCWRALVEKFEAETGKRPRVHDLRHTGASWMLSNGGEILDVQRHLGHESANTTLKIYGHCDRRSGQRAATSMSRALVGAALRVA